MTQIWRANNSVSVIFVISMYKVQKMNACFISETSRRYLLKFSVWGLTKKLLD